MKFRIGDGSGRYYTLAKMLRENADDQDFCEWAKSAKHGDHYPSWHGVSAIDDDFDQYGRLIA